MREPVAMAARSVVQKNARVVKGREQLAALYYITDLDGQRRFAVTADYFHQFTAR
jgi:hypothetical protein